ncbi:MAG: glycosyltransferase family 39 protein [Desulfovibrionaceae bacterium]
MSRTAVLSLCVAAGFALRAAYILLCNTGIAFPDEDRYWAQALSVAQGDGVTYNGEWAHDMPLTAMLFGAVVWLAGPNMLAVKLANALVGALTALPVALLAESLYPARRTLVLAGAATAAYPFLVYNASLLMTDALFALLVAALFCALAAPRRPHAGSGMGRGVAQGVVAGLAYLTRPTTLFFMPCIWAWNLLADKARLRAVCVAALLFCACCAAWGLRNHAVLGSFLLTTSGSGHALYEGNNPWNKDGGVSDLSWGWLDEMPQGLGELEASAWKKARGEAWITDHPGAFARLAWKKFLRFWSLWPNAAGYDRGVYLWASLLSFGPVLALALASLWVLRDRLRRTALIWLFMGYYTALHMVIIGSIRYRLPLEPLLIALAAATLARLTGANETRSTRLA